MSFEVGPSIFEGLDRPSLNPLRMIFDILEETMPVETYKGLGFWTPEGYWRFPIGTAKGFEELLMEQCGEDGPKAIRVSISVSIYYLMTYVCVKNMQNIHNLLTYVVPPHRNGTPSVIV